MKTGPILTILALCLAGCASSPVGHYGQQAQRQSAQDAVFYGLSSLDSYQSNPTDQNFCDALCQYARHVESNRLIAEARRREDRLRTEQTEDAFENFFDSPDDATDGPTLPVVIRKSDTLVCESGSGFQAGVLAPCH